MNALIPVVPANIGGQSIPAVDARELHSFLQVGKDFTNWIKDRIEQYGFYEGQDYLLAKIGEQLPSGTKYRSEYTLSLDMAKELSMVERNDRGKQARQYFIDCERRAKAAPAIPQSLPEALRLAADLAEQNAAQAALIHEQAPKVAALHRLSGADGAVCITTAAKDLQIRPKDLFQWLQANEWIYRRPGGSGWLAYQHRLQQGVLTHKVTTVHRGDGTEKQTEQVLVTPKGLVRLAEVLQERAA